MSAYRPYTEVRDEWLAKGWHYLDTCDGYVDIVLSPDKQHYYHVDKRRTDNTRFVYEHSVLPIGHHYKYGASNPCYQVIEAALGKDGRFTPTQKLTNPCQACGCKEARLKRRYCSDACWRAAAGAVYARRV